MRRAVLWILAFTFLITGLAAHPHVFIEHTVEIQVNDSGVHALKLRWVFDEMFSSMLIQDFDTNKNKKIDPSENPVVKKNGFDNLLEYHYFVFMKMGGKSFYPSRAGDFQASIANNRLVYSFTVPVTLKTGGFPAKAELVIKDPSNYADLTLIKGNPVTVLNTGSLKISHRVVDNRAQFRRTGEGYPEIMLIELRK